jgi:ParB family chromosome partitioning protein
MTATITAPKRTTKPTAKPASKAGKPRSATAKARTSKTAAKSLPTGMPLMIGLDKLAADPMNVRPSSGDVNELAASIAAHGVIQPLAVRPETRPDRKSKDAKPRPTGRYLVVAGGRRLRALMKLAGDRRLPKDAGVPCVVRQGTERDAMEVSLAENVERLPMNAADEHAAFAKLADEGMSSTDIAARFGIHKRRVEQRLALGRIAPDLLVELRSGAMTAGVAQVLTLTTSHEKQRDVWRQCKGGWNSEVQARRLLTEQTMNFDDPQLRFVSRDAYEKAGGPVRVDLFSKNNDDAGFAEDASLVRKLAAGKLDAEAEKVGKADGWSFVVHELQDDTDAYGYRREQPTRREPTKAEAERQATVEQELTAMEDEGWDESTAEGRAAAERWNRLEQELEDLEASREVWTAEQKQRCGVYLGIGESGQVVQRRGLVDPAWGKKQRQEAEAKRAESETPGTKVQASAGDKSSADEPADDTGVEMSRSLVWKLTKARTEALRASMIENPAASADLFIAHLCERFFFSIQFAGRDPLPFEVDLRAGRDDFCAGAGKSDPARGSHGTPQPSEAQAVFYDALQKWRSRLPQTPDALPAFVAGLSPDDKTSLLALLSAAALDTVNESVGDFHGSKGDQTIRRVASHIGCDVTKWWKPTAASFFSGLTKAGIAAALDEAYTQTHGKTLSSGAGVDGLKKNAAAGRAEALVSKLDWLPLPLRSAHQPHQSEPDNDSQPGPIKLPTAKGTTRTKQAA